MNDKKCQSLRNYLMDQHHSPEIQAKIEKLLAMPEQIHRNHNNLATYTHDPSMKAVSAMLKAIFEDLNRILD